MAAAVGPSNGNEEAGIDSQRITAQSIVVQVTKPDLWLLYVCQLKYFTSKRTHTLRQTLSVRLQSLAVKFIF